MDSKELKTRFSGCILGFAVGDALGMPSQFLTRDQVLRYYGKPISDYIRAHPGHASDFLMPGCYTDDTQMMLATAECLVECQKLDPAKQADTLLSWYLNSTPRRTPMRAILRACKHLSTGKPWTKSGVFSACCSAAVRMPPVGLFYHNNPEMLGRAAIDLCTVTHTEPRAQAASVAVACLVARLVHSTERCSTGKQVLEVADRVADIDKDVAAMLRWVTQIVHLPPEEALFEIGTSSDAIETLSAAVYCFLKHPRQYSNAVLPAVNAGEAADSIAALTGCFVASFAGLEAIPPHFAQNVENRDVLIGVGENLARVARGEEMSAASM